jgi:hypothetical protein
MRFLAAYFVVALFLGLLLPIPSVGFTFGQVISLLIALPAFVPLNCLSRLLDVTSVQVPWVIGLCLAALWVLFAVALADYIAASRRDGTHSAWVLNAAILPAGLPTFVWVASFTFGGGPF